MIHARATVVRITLLASRLSPLALTLLAAPLGAQSLAARADSIFGRWAGDGAPGCAIAVDHGDSAVYRGAFGLAELEYAIPNTDTTIFEAGSVSKQFTAASVLLLAARGVLSLDDPIQQWFPEIPVYAAPITIRHLMLHTSGLRDWGSVMSLAGWGRWTATYTQDDALAIIARQRGLNHVTGAEFSYTNSGYNLLAILVERAAKQSFQDFMTREFFAPLGMRHTSWRADYTRVVPGRAQAYARAGGAWHLDMPFEDVVGNGGLLTTVQDLLTWTHALHAGRLGRPDVSTAMLTSGTFNDGRPVNYGGGLFLGPLRGVPSINHGGSTAGYRTLLAAFPAQHVMAAILCNRGDANATRLMIDLLQPLVPFAAATPSVPAPVAAPFRLDPGRLTDYTGRFRSEEVPATLDIRVTRGQLTVSRKPGDSAVLRPQAVDEFTGLGGTFQFVRDDAGRITRLIVTIPRVVGMPFERID
ncbi:MAG TPA: serine hydrolase domain-containing protein [Gemmatimonadales bacterium]|nr:serine hydrolase domain-containing protein [Gemmatimonadales bacterium]